MRLIAAVGGMLGCGPVIAVEEQGIGTGGSTGGASSSSSTAISTTGEPMETSATAEPDIGVATAGFLPPPGDLPPWIQCSIFEQDCPRGEKCMPCSYDDTPTWNATCCSPIVPDPAHVGEACTVDGNGIDSCDGASMCWDVDADTLEGTCVAFCVGSENNPACAQRGYECNITSDGTLLLCIATCDPLEQDCPEGDGCWGVVDDFVCAPDASGDAGGYGDPCEYINVCDPGLACAVPEAVPGCASVVGCCSPYCALDESVQCPGAGQECVPYFEPGGAPPGLEDVGLCAVPA